MNYLEAQPFSEKYFDLLKRLPWPAAEIALVPKTGDSWMMSIPIPTSTVGSPSVGQGICFNNTTKTIEPLHQGTPDFEYFLKEYREFIVGWFDVLYDDDVTLFGVWKTSDRAIFEWMDCAFITNGFYQFTNDPTEAIHIQPVFYTSQARAMNDPDEDGGSEIPKFYHMSEFASSKSFIFNTISATIEDFEGHFRNALTGANYIVPDIGMFPVPKEWIMYAES